jgi:hypothetical protein
MKWNKNPKLKPKGKFKSTHTKIFYFRVMARNIYLVQQKLFEFLQLLYQVDISEATNLFLGRNKKYEFKL